MIVEVVLVEAEGQEEDVVDGDDGGQRLGVVGTVGQQVRLHRSQDLLRIQNVFKRWSKSKATWILFEDFLFPYPSFTCIVFWP